MQLVSSRIWTRVAVSISYDDNHYTTGTWMSLFVITKVQPPDSADCYIPDHYLCGVVERETIKTPYNTKDKLKANITAVVTSLNKEMVGKTYRRFRSRLEAMFEANGDFFE